MGQELQVVKKDYYVTFTDGACLVIRASSEHLALCFAILHFGDTITPHIQEATPGQIEWVKNTGGQVHEIN